MQSSPDLSSTLYKHWFSNNPGIEPLDKPVVSEGQLLKNDTLEIIGTLATLRLIDEYSKGLAHIELVSREENVQIKPLGYSETLPYYFFTPFVWNLTRREELLGFTKRTCWHVPTHDPYHRVPDRTNTTKMTLTNGVATEVLAIHIPNR